MGEIATEIEEIHPNSISPWSSHEHQYAHHCPAVSLKWRRRNVTSWSRIGLGAFFGVDAGGEDIKAGSICGDATGSSQGQQIHETGAVQYILMPPSGPAGFSIKLRLFEECCETFPSLGDCTAADIGLM